MHEGEYKAGNFEGRGTYRWADGNAYEGEYKANKYEGRGTFRYADGHVETSFWKADVKVGEGVYWTADGQTAWTMHDGTPMAPQLSLEEARRVVAEHGLPLPEGV